MHNMGRFLTSAVVGGVLAALYALEFELGWDPSSGTGTLIPWAAGGALAGLGLAALVDLPVVHEFTTPCALGGSHAPDIDRIEPRAPLTQPIDVSLDDIRLARVESGKQRWSTRAATICLVLVSIGLGAVGADWSIVALRLMSAPGDSFWWGLDAMLSMMAGVIVLAIGITIVAAALFGFYTARRLLQRAVGARSHAIYVFLFGILLFFARSYSSPMIWVAGIVISSCGAVLVLLPSTSADFERPDLDLI